MFLDALARMNGTRPGRSDMPTTAGRPEDATSNPATPVPEPSSNTTTACCSRLSVLPEDDGGDSSDPPAPSRAPLDRRRHTSGWVTYMPSRIPASHTVNPVAGIGSTDVSSGSPGVDDEGWR